MEFLVAATTQVPDGTPAEAVDDLRARESARCRELARQGQLLRLWRAPSPPGRWRTLGLFAAADDNALEQLLASTPLRAWRTEEVTPLPVHPNDPTARLITPEPVSGGAAEFLQAITIRVPADAPQRVVDDVLAREAERAGELGAQGCLQRLWWLHSGPGDPRVLALWRTADTESLAAVLRSLPLHAWLQVDTTTPLHTHPDDPVSGSLAGR